MIFDNTFTLDKQQKAVVRAISFKLRAHAKVKPSLSFADFEKVSHTFISSSLDYCKILYLGVSQPLLSCLQLMQNAAASVLFHIRTSPTLNILKLIVSLCHLNHTKSWHSGLV